MKFSDKQITEGRLADGGPIYRETDLSGKLVEPLNGLSALLFLAIAIYWLIRLGARWRENVFLCFLLLVLGVGGVGGAVFHAFRSHYFFFLLDVIPILIAGTLTGLYLWAQWFQRPMIVAVILLVIFLLRMALRAIVPRAWNINASYLFLAATILMPLFLLVRKEKYRGVRELFIAVGAFLFGILFRYIDSYPIAWAPHGTHWLWHTFTAISVFFLAKYIVERNSVSSVNKS